MSNMNESPTSPEYVLALSARIEAHQREIIDDGALALAGIFQELAMRKNGYSDQIEPPSKALIEQGNWVIGRMGISDDVVLVNKMAKGEEIVQDQSTRDVFGQTMRTIRRKNGMTQTQFGNKLGVSRFTINRIETGLVANINDYKRLLDELFGEDGHSPQ